MNISELPYSLMSELGRLQRGKNPPVHLWHPETESDIDLVISKDGVWNYCSSPIKRPRLIRLFASVLRRDRNEYYLVTPIEKCRITVEDVPFQAVLMQASGEGSSACLQLTTDMGEQVRIDEKHPLRIFQDGEDTVPYVLVRDGMECRLSRNVYYQLAELMVPNRFVGNEGEWMGVWSHGIFFPMLPV